MGMERIAHLSPSDAHAREEPEAGVRMSDDPAMTHTHHGESGYPQQARGEGYQQGVPPVPLPAAPEERRGVRGEHRAHPYLPPPHSQTPQGGQDIPHIVIDPGDNGDRRRPMTIPPLDLHAERKLTVLTLAAKKQRAHSDSVLETHISDAQKHAQRHSSSCSDAPTESPSPEELAGSSSSSSSVSARGEQQRALNLALGRGASPSRSPTHLDKPQVPFIWSFKRQSPAEETSGSDATYWLRRHSDSTLPNDPEDLSLSPTRSLSTGDTGEGGEARAPPTDSSGSYSQGVIHKRLKLKKYLQTRYQSSLQQEESPPGDAPVKVEPKDFSLPRKPAPLSFLPEGVAREMIRSVSDSDLEPEPETPVFTPLDVFSPAPPTPHSSKDATDISTGGLKFKFSSFDHLNLSPGTRGSSEAGSLQEDRKSPSQMSVVSTGTERSMEEGSPRGTPDPRGVTLSPGGSHPASSPGSQPGSSPISPVSEGGSRSHPISPHSDLRPYKTFPERSPHRAGRFHSGGHPLISPSPTKERQFFTAPAPLSAPPYLSESPPEVSPYPPVDPARSAFPWTPMSRDQEKGKVHFFPPEMFAAPHDMERYSAMQARAIMESQAQHHHQQQQAHAQQQQQAHAQQQQQQAQQQVQQQQSQQFYSQSPCKPALPPTSLGETPAGGEQTIPSPFPSPFPSPITLKVEPGSPKPEGGSRKVQQCQFTEQVLEQPLGTGGSGFVCPVCGQLFPSYNYLANHMVNHLPSEVLPKGPGDNNKIHLCKVCNRSFSRSDMLTRHMRLHTGLRPYECRVCGQVFSRSDHLHTHLRTHTGEKPYKCPQCPYAAPRRDMITRHLRIHTKHVVRRGRRSYSASSSLSREGDEGPRRGQSLSSLDSFESGEQSPGPGVKEGEQYQRRSASLASCDSLESPLPSATLSVGSSFDFDPSEIPSDSGAVSPSPLGGSGGFRRRHDYPSSSSFPGEGDADPKQEPETDIQTSFQKCTVGGGEVEGSDKAGTGQRHSS